MHSFSITSKNIAISHILLKKLNYLDYIVVGDNGSIVNHFLRNMLLKVPN